MARLYKIPLILEPQPEGGYTVTSPAVPELVTEGETVDEVMANVQDALKAVMELYDDLGRAMPAALQPAPERESITFEGLVVGA